MVSTSTPESLPAPPANLGSEREILASVKEKRQSFIDHKINSIQLTRDQKPEDPEELERITKAGGRVQRLVDNLGNNIGPYRVWEQSTNVPGLAMSRSIGDLLAKRMGVVSTPICTKHKIKRNDDFFIVIASDGVWDVMENDDVVNFVECFRRKCKMEPDGDDLVTPNNSCIAQLLAEEARIRWFSIVAEEDVKIDDISVLVAEMNFSEKPVHTRMEKTMKRLTVMKKDSDDQIEYFRAPSIKEVAIADPKRSSVVGESPSRLDID